MNITDRTIDLVLAAWIAAAAVAYLWQFVPLLPHILHTLGMSS